MWLAFPISDYYGLLPLEFSSHFLLLRNIVYCPTLHFFRVSVVPYDISLHNAVAPASTPSVTLLSTTEGLRANILYWINTVTKMTYAFTATESHIDLLSLISDNPTLRSLLPAVLSNRFRFYTHSIFMDSRVIWNHLRSFHAPSPSFIHCGDNLTMHIGDLELRESVFSLCRTRTYFFIIEFKP